MAIMVAILGWLITSYPKIGNLLILGAVFTVLALLLVIIAFKCDNTQKV